MAIKGENGILYIWGGASYKPVVFDFQIVLNTAVSTIEKEQNVILE